VLEQRTIIIEVDNERRTWKIKQEITPQDLVVRESRFPRYAGSAESMMLRDRRESTTDKSK
jgi:hypothetical protein